MYSRTTVMIICIPGGNAKTAIICAVTPAAMSEEQTVSTLRFATQAKAIKNHAQVNEVLDDAAKINRMKKEMAIALLFSATLHIPCVS